MSSGGDKKQTTTQTTTNSAMPAWVEPYARNYLGRAQDVANQPYVGYDGPRIAGFTDDQLAGFDMVRQQAGQGNPLMGQAQDYLSSQMAGAHDFNAQENPYLNVVNPYAGQNQYLDSMIQSAQGDVTRQYRDSVAPNLMAQFNAAGAYGGTANQAALANSQRELAGELGDISTTLRNADYDRQSQLSENWINRNTGLANDYLNRQQSAWNQNQANQMNAVGMLPSLNDMRYGDARALMNIGQQQQNMWQGLYDQGYEDFRDWRDYDRNQLGVLSEAVRSLQGGGSSSSSATGANPNYRSAGQNAATAAAIIASMWGD